MKANPAMSSFFVAGGGALVWAVTSSKGLSSSSFLSY
jgi:hypothetical protein